MGKLLTSEGTFYMFFNDFFLKISPVARIESELGISLIRRVFQIDEKAPIIPLRYLLNKMIFGYYDYIGTPLPHLLHLVMGCNQFGNRNVARERKKVEDP
uniref:Uncharacterized protein n=1 Tax=Cacopsylla melanoneura TaxID=428564 RepID=A0A8D9E971_9HEMI